MRRKYALMTFFLKFYLCVGSIHSQVREERSWYSEIALQEIQKAIVEKKAPWTAGMNDIFLLSPEEKRKLCGCRDSISLEKISESQQIMRFALQPEKFDWRDKDGSDWMSPVKNQGACGSCVAFCTIGTLEGQLNIYHNDPDLDRDLSEQHIFSCGGGGCDGGWYTDVAFQYLQDHGAPDEDCFPYTSGETGTDQPCNNTCSDWQERAVKISCWDWVGGDFCVKTPAEIKKEILKGPVATSMTVYEDFYAYIEGIYEHVWGEVVDEHCVVFVGWDDTSDPPCWIVRNSWGMWGESGYYRIRMGTNEVGIEARNLVLAIGDVPKGVVSERKHYFGEVKIGESKDLEMSILNEGNADLEISNWVSDFLDYSVSFPSFPQYVIPGESLNITITFSPIDLGVKQGEMTILGNSYWDLPTLKVLGKGIHPYVRLSPSIIDLFIRQGEIKTVPLKLTNTADNDLHYTVTAPEEWLSIVPASGTLELGGNKTLEVGLDATSLTAGEKVSGTIFIDTNTPEYEQPTVSVTLNVMEAALVTVSLPSNVKIVNGTCNVGVVVDNGTQFFMPLAEVTIQLGYDPFLFEVQSVSATPRTEIMSSFMWSVLQPGELSLMISDSTEQQITSGTDAVAEISFVLQEENVCNDTSWLFILDVSVVDTTGTIINVEVDDGLIVFFCRGDVDDNGTVNIVDVLGVVNHILDIQGLSGDALQQADCNGDGNINILDALGIVNVILGIGSCEP